MVIFTGKDLCYRPSGLQLYYKEPSTQIFLCKDSKALKAAILKNICEGLLFYLTDFSEQLVLRHFSKTVYLSYLFLTFMSVLFYWIYLFD